MGFRHNFRPGELLPELGHGTTLVYYIAVWQVSSRRAVEATELSHFPTKLTFPIFSLTRASGIIREENST